MKRLFLIAALAVSGLSAVGQDYEWKAVQMDGSRTGCVSPSKDNVKEALGSIKGRKYEAPNGRTYRAKSSVGKAARVVIDAQPAMAKVKDVIGYSTSAMTVKYPESAL